MDPARSEAIVAGAVVFAMVLSGPLAVIQPSEPPSIGEGDADVTVLAPEGGEIPLTAGRFGTGVAYLRVPDLTAAVGNVSGSPELLYEISVPALDLTVRERRVLSSNTNGRVRMLLDHRGLPREVLEADSYAGRVLVRLQSFSTERVLVNRSVTVAVGG